MNQTKMALSLSRIILASKQSVLQQTSLCAGAQSIRWRTRKRRQWLEEDQKDTSWMEPMLEYSREKEAKGDPEPAMLHVVYRTKILRDRPWWEKKVIEKLGLDVSMKTPVILKNTPAVNDLLKEVKHLVTIQPLRFPHGFPDDPRDYPHTQLKSTGELVVKKTVDPLSEVTHAEPEDQSDGQKWALKIETVKKELKRKMDSYEIHEEYVKPHYTYTRNQDGKEYRYNERFNKPTEKK